MPRLAAISFAKSLAWGLLVVGAYLAGAVLAEKARRWWL
jgi:hypothetical protein